MYSVEKDNDESLVLFYRLGRKFVDEKDVPDEAAREILYYSLAIGHHLGIVDCLDEVMRCTRKEYRDWLSVLPIDGDAYKKMMAFFTFGEITILEEHIHLLAFAFDAMPNEHQTEKSKALTQGLLKTLTAIHQEPSMYLMIRGKT
jgi:formate hydrogenlyase maturation protein HycH